MGNDNPIRNNKLLREAYQAGRRSALNEQMSAGGPMPSSGMGMGRNMGMGMGNPVAPGQDAMAAGKIPSWQQAPLNPRFIPDWLLPYYTPANPGVHGPYWGTPGMTQEEWDRIREEARP